MQEEPPGWGVVPGAPCGALIKKEACLTSRPGSMPGTHERVQVRLLEEKWGVLESFSWGPRALK